jgi:hypothetical protein
MIKEENMFRKCTYVVALLCVLAMGNIALGAVHQEYAFQSQWVSGTRGTAADSNWFNQNNWLTYRNDANFPLPPGYTMGPDGRKVDPNIVPCQNIDPNIWTVIEAKSPGPNVVTGPSFYGDAACSRLVIHPWTWTSYPPLAIEMNVFSGTINCGAQIGLCSKTGTPPIKSNASANTDIAMLSVYGGAMTAPGFWTLGADGNDYLDRSGLWIGGGDDKKQASWGHLKMYGGSITVPQIQIYYGDVNLYGGLLYQNDANEPNFLIISISQAMNKINIEGNEVSGGELRLQGDRSAKVWEWASQGRICPCWGRGTLFVDYNSAPDANYTSVTAFCTPGSAWNPIPRQLATRQELSTTLSWSPGPWAQKTLAHGVYFGLDYNSVNDDNESNVMGTYKGRQDPCTYSPGQLIMDTPYYWRIDEYNDACSSPPSPWKGNVWQFRTKGPEAGTPSPADGTVGLSIPLQLSWSPGALTQPTNGHAVFFGTDYDSVFASTIPSPVPGVSKYIQDSNIFPLSTLDYNLAADTNYYWRVDEINDACGNSPWKGPVWNFVNTNYFIIDNFESYVSAPDPNAAMRARWKNSGSCSGHGNSAVIGWMYALPGEGRENGTAWYHYDNSGFTGSFAEVRFDVNTLPAGGGDWTGGGALPDNDKARALAISYLGSQFNEAEPNYNRMYVAIEDTAGHRSDVNISNSEAQRIGAWTRWDVNLTDLNKPNVDLKSVKCLYIGFGVRCTYRTLGGIGTVRFDDIRLYQKRCIPELASPDLTGDCRVDINEVNIFADNWLVKQTVVSPVTKPPDANLMLWYKFDETGGTIAADSSGHGKNGTVVEDPNIFWEPTGGFDGNGCLNLKLSYYRPDLGYTIDYNTFVECPNSALSFVADKNAITFSTWVKADTYMQDGFPRLIAVFQDMNDMNTTRDLNEVVEISCPIPRAGSDSTVRFRSGLNDDSNEVSKTSMSMSDFGGTWQHYAFVKDANARLMRIYHNGGLIAETNQTTSPMFGKEPIHHPIESFRLGKRRPYTDEPWAGRIDDFRVYNYALSQNEIAWLGTKDHLGYVPFSNVANFKSSAPSQEVVNFGDYAILAQKWMAGLILWP